MGRSRTTGAGPALPTPEAQCQGRQALFLAMAAAARSWTSGTSYGWPLGIAARSALTGLRSAR